MLFNLFLTLGVAVLSVALRSFQSSFSQEAGAIGILVVSYLAIYFITGSQILGAVAAAAWLFFPWVGVLNRIRGLRLPQETQFRPKTPRPLHACPLLREYTRELGGEG